PLVGGEDLLGRVFQIEDTVVDRDDGIGKRDLHVKARLGNDPHWLAETNHQSLLGLINREQRPVRRKRQEDGNGHDCADKIGPHRPPPVVDCCAWAGGRFRSSGSGRYGITPDPPCPEESSMTLSVPPNRRSMVSR